MRTEEMREGGVFRNELSPRKFEFANNFSTKKSLLHHYYVAMYVAEFVFLKIMNSIQLTIIHT